MKSTGSQPRNIRAGGCLLVLAVAAFGFTSCTAKYKQLILEREREIAALKDEKSRMEAENRSLRATDDSVRERLKVALGENNQLKTVLNQEREKTLEKPVHEKAVDGDLAELARGNGLQVMNRPEGVAVDLPSSLTFRSGSADLSPGGKTVLGKLAHTIKTRFPSRMISIEGHTDSQPIKRSKFGTNWRLSVERAESVRCFLFKKGISKQSKVRVVGYGPTVPVTSNKRESGRKQNRRVELVILNS